MPSLRCIISVSSPEREPGSSPSSIWSSANARLDIDATTAKPRLRKRRLSIVRNHSAADEAVSGSSSHSRPGVSMWIAAPASMVTCLTPSARERSIEPLSLRVQ